MVTFDSESLDTANSTGSSAGFQEPLTGLSTSYKGAAPQTADGGIGTGNPGTFAEGCYGESDRSRRFLQPLICSPQERRGLASYHQSQTAEYFSVPHFKMESILSLSNLEISCQTQPKGCIPDCSNLPRAQEVPSLQVERPEFSIQDTPLQIGHSSKNFHETHIPGRHVANGGILRHKHFSGDP